MTLLGWMLYVTLVGAFLSLAAWLVEQGASRYRLPLRWIWVGALALGVLIPVWGVLAPAPVGAGGDIGPVEGAAWVGSMGSTEGEAAPEPVGPVAWGQGIVLAVNRALQGASDAVGGRAEVNALLGWGWGAASAFFLTLLLAGAVRLRRRSRRWIPVRLGEREVLIAPTTGPAVVGLVQPRIVIPARYRELAADEVNLILEHETEHIRARDPVLLAVSLIPLILAPWNPSFWWSFHRLRAAMEVDCDGRVLAGGARPARYGGLLLQMGCSGSRQTLPALSLAGTPSTLERRLNAMNDSSTRNALPVSIICGVLAVGVTVLACQADTPTGPEQTAQQDIRTEAPQFTPFTVAPEVLNRSEIARALQREYPSDLREAGIGGTTIVHLFIDAEGTVGNVLVANSSENERLDEAALEVATAFQFSPALNREEPVPVWIQIPITFASPAAESDTRASDTGEGASREEIHEAPRFTPFTVAPEVRNRDEVGRALEREYPSELRDAGIGGTVLLHFFIDDDGIVQNTLVAESSGHTGLDQAAERVAQAFEFSPAFNREQRVPVWIQIPITFSIR